MLLEKQCFIKNCHYFFLNRTQIIQWLQTAKKNHPIKLHHSYPYKDRQCHRTVAMAPVARMCRFYLALFYIKMIQLTYHDLKAKLYFDENLFYKFCCQPKYFILGELKFVFSKKMSLFLFNIKDCIMDGHEHAWFGHISQKRCVSHGFSIMFCCWYGLSDNLLNE